MELPRICASEIRSHSLQGSSLCPTWSEPGSWEGSEGLRKESMRAEIQLRLLRPKQDGFIAGRYGLCGGMRGVREGAEQCLDAVCHFASFFFTPVIISLLASGHQETKTAFLFLRLFLNSSQLENKRRQNCVSLVPQTILTSNYPHICLEDVWGPYILESPLCLCCATP